MSRIRSKGTKPEVEVRRKLHAAGLRFRLHRRDLPGCPDLVLARFRTALFVHGCFWHGHGCGRAHQPKTNGEYWSAKIARNMARDHEVRQQLADLGWQVEVVWECAVADGTASVMNRLRANADS
ncbi:MAG: DNA mismatch endonuclease Vsr [Rhizobiales bacterium]|nr:DNA mismatch endonuclease Vsr [Hyphomicrobiales bacterium]